MMLPVKGRPRRRLLGWLSFIVPLVLLTRRRAIMGALVNRPLTTALASVVAALIIFLNAFLVFQTFA